MKPNETLMVEIVRRARQLMVEEDCSGMAFCLGGIRININNEDRGIAKNECSEGLEHLTMAARQPL